MKTITTEKQIIMSDDTDCHSYAKERIKLKRCDEPGGKSFVSVEFINLEPDEYYPAGCLTFCTKDEIAEAFLVIQDFLDEVQAGQDDNGDIC